MSDPHWNLVSILLVKQLQHLVKVSYYYHIQTLYCASTLRVSVCQAGWIQDPVPALRGLRVREWDKSKDAEDNVVIANVE